MISLQINIDANNSKDANVDLINATKNKDGITSNITNLVNFFINNRPYKYPDYYFLNTLGDLDNLSPMKKYKPKDKYNLRDLVIKLILTYGPDVNLNNIDTSLITDMSYLFNIPEAFKLPLEADEKYRDMFNPVLAFNGDVSNWDVSNVKNFEGMFAFTKFNGDLSKWNTSKAETMEGMFKFSEFNNNSISNWNVSNVEDFSNMFRQSKFNQPLNNWNTSSALLLEEMFMDSDFNNIESLKNWNIQNVQSIGYMFNGCKGEASIKSLGWDLSNLRFHPVLPYEMVSEFNKEKATELQNRRNSYENSSLKIEKNPQASKGSLPESRNSNSKLISKVKTRSSKELENYKKRIQEKKEFSDQIRKFLK